MDKSRTQLLIGKSGVDKLKSKKVIVVGLGGVGGYVAVMLARAGVENFALVDFDRVSESNINRQIIATTKTVNMLKTEALSNLLTEINPKVKIEAFPVRLTSENIENVISNCDMCVDAIDSVSDKAALVIYCKKHNIPIISAMGAGNRVDIPHFYLTDIYKTHDDGLAKALRKKLREAKIESLEVVTCDSKPVENHSGTIGSISYYPAMCGITISAIIINKFLEKI